MNNLKITYWFLCIICSYSIAYSQPTFTDWSFTTSPSPNIEIQVWDAKTKFLSIQFSSRNDHRNLLDSIRKVNNNNPAPLQINGQVFTGELEGRYANGKLMFQTLYWRGVRAGNFLYVNPKGDSSWFYFPYPKRYYEEIGLQWGIFGNLEKSLPNQQRLNPDLLETGTYIFELKDNEGAVKKPVIYLYPTEKTEISVKLDFDQKQLTHTYPKYNSEKGWNIVAEPNGNLKNVENGKDYYALFWEAESQKPTEIKQGFVVKGENTAEFLEEKLAVLGLNWRESNEFIMYWLPQMENNKYNLIHFSTEEYTNNFPVTITPQPDNFIRVFMVFEPLEKAIEMPNQELKAAKRGGFTAVEWGGMKQEKPKF